MGLGGVQMGALMLAACLAAVAAGQPGAGSNAVDGLVGVGKRRRPAGRRHKIIQHRR
jgi:plasmid stabilization system protein ParE